MTQSKISSEQYKSLQNVFKNLNNDSYTSDEERKRIAEARK